ncbi:MAG: hypothetical protein KGL90_00800 [Burkholderiales bacterium]|nr:hypothetical protein [Burkholderiales bacterium]
MPDKNKLVVVDTNCLVRMYFSALRPMLGATFSGYILMTLQELADELKNLASNDKHAWLSDQGIQAEVDGAVIKLTRQQEATIKDETPKVRRYGNAELQRYKDKNNVARPLTLSLADARALTAAIELGAALATDEWPLRLVAGYIQADDNGGYVELLSSVELLHLLEKAGAITKDERVKVYAHWRKSSEALLGDSDARYKALFGEAAPTAQD